MIQSHRSLVFALLALQALGANWGCGGARGSVPATRDAGRDGFEKGAVGWPCGPDAGLGQATFNTSDMQCQSHICIGSRCSAECQSDEDCNRGSQDKTVSTCTTDFACGVAFMVGPLCCKRICVCKDFLRTLVTPAECLEEGQPVCRPE